MKRPNDKVPLLLFGGCIFLCWFFVLREGVFASKVDWISQHSVFPDYFRQLFYSTGNLFNNFAPQLGGGQNLFNFSYYGLYSPIILFSYLLPFVKMSDYIMGSSIFCYCISVTLFYRWIKEKCVNPKTAAGLAWMFALAAPMVYQSYNQIMFVNYMPFLCLALMGTDQYQKEKKSGLLLFGTVGMILTSFYFSIGGMLGLLFYGISQYWKEKNSHDFLWWLVGYGMRLFTAVMCCGALLIPTAAALCGGRCSMGKWNWSLIIPEFCWEKLLYHPHGIGLSASIVVVLLAGVFSRKSKERLLSVFLLLLLIIPAFGLLLNGGLYAKTKVFIPFLPLFVYLYVPFLNHQTGRWGRRMQVILPFAAAGVLFITDMGIHKVSDKMLEPDFYEEVTGKNTALQMESVTEEKGLYRMEELKDARENKANINRIHTMKQSITSVYSSAYNREYMEFRKNYGLNEPYRNDMMQPVTDNPCFLAFMGVKYLWTHEDIPGYQRVFAQIPKGNQTKTKAVKKEDAVGEEYLLKNENVLPTIYSTNRLLSQEAYENLPFPDNETALLQTAVVEEAGIKKQKEQGEERESEETKEVEAMVPSVLCETNCTLPKMSEDTVQITATKDGYDITAKKEVQLTLEINRGTEDDLLAVAFEVRNYKPQQDMYIKVEKQTNKLTSVSHEYANENETFTYVVGTKAGQKQVKFTLGKGSYRLCHMNFFTGKWDNLSNTGLCQNVFRPDDHQWKSKWDGSSYIAGNMMAAHGSYLITSLPFDRGFTIFVDGNRVETVRVNTAFLGCRISKGEHKIRIVYEAKGFRLGVIFSLIGFGGVITWIFLSKCRKYPRKRSK